MLLCAFAILALVWPLPGIAITVAMQELAALNVTTGASRLVLSYFALIQLGLGTDYCANSANTALSCHR